MYRRMRAHPVDAARIRRRLRNPLHTAGGDAAPVRNWRLPTRPTKGSDGRSRSFGAILVELDAISPDRLRGLVRGAVERHLSSEQYEVLKVAEGNEREGLEALAAAEAQALVWEA